VVPVELMKLVAVSGVNMRLVAGCLVHIGNILLVVPQLIVFHVVFGRGICPLVALLVPCVC
jgi:hypothetical protein